MACAKLKNIITVLVLALALVVPAAAQADSFTFDNGSDFLATLDITNYTTSGGTQGLELHLQMASGYNGDLLAVFLDLVPPEGEDSPYSGYEGEPANLSFQIWDTSTTTDLSLATDITGLSDMKWALNGNISWPGANLNGVGGTIDYGALDLGVRIGGQGSGTGGDFDNVIIRIASDDDLSIPAYVALRAQSTGDSGGDSIKILGLADDDVNPSAETPEPGTMILLGSALAGAAFWRRKKSQKDPEQAEEVA